MPKAIDLFCGAGGASRGLADAGFEVAGVDNEARSYPYKFFREDVTRLFPAVLQKYDFVWASPPCQGFTAYKRRPNHVKPRLNLIPHTRELLQAAGVPYVIENVTGAREHLRNPVLLCGSMFGLDVQRHRLFECSFPVEQPPCRHDIWTPRFPQATNRTNKRKTVEVGVWRIPLSVQRAAMGIEWMELEELSEAIPPAYSRYLAEQFLKSRG